MFISVMVDFFGAIPCAFQDEEGYSFIFVYFVRL